MKRLAILGALTLAAALGLSACGSGSNSRSASEGSTSMSMPTVQATAGSSSNNGSGQAALITIKNFGYSGTTSVAPGTKVTVMNDDSEAHTVTSDDGKAFDVKIDPGSSATFTAPSAAGTYAYHCAYHSNMHGSLTVS